MKKIINKFFITLFLFSFYFASSFAERVHFIDFVKVLNKSKAGSTAQEKLKTKFQTETKKFKELEENIRKTEKEIISQKKLITNEEYQKKIGALRKRISDLQKNKTASFSNIAKSRNNAKKALLEAVNPIMKKYMEDNKIQLVLDKSGVLMGDQNLEITDQIIAILNKELSSLKVN